MKRSTQVMAVSVLAVTSVAAIVRAQGPGGQPGGPGGFQPGGPGGFGGGRGGFGRGNMVMGTVSAVDAQAGTITVAGPAGAPGGAGGNNPAQVITVPATATITSQATIKVSDLKRGDQIQVTGTPTAITFTSLTAGQAPTMGGGGFGGGGGAFAAPGAAPTPPRATSFASASGVVSLSPLTLWVDKDTPIALKMTADAKVTKYSTGTLASVKAGDTVMIAGQTGADGSFAATSVGVNIASPFGGGFGRGGFGGGFNGGGPGGPGGFGGGRGGFGRRNRGGGGADPNAAPGVGAPPPPAPGPGQN